MYLLYSNTVEQNIIHTGFVAQEIETLVNELGYDFDGLNVPRHDYDNYSVSYSTFVVPLVKAVQEQQAVVSRMEQTEAASQLKVKEFEQKVNDQQTMIEQLIQRVENLEKEVNN